MRKDEVDRLISVSKNTTLKGNKKVLENDI
jgi:hypothetical protein